MNYLEGYNNYMLYAVYNMMVFYTVLCIHYTCNMNLLHWCASKPHYIIYKYSPLHVCTTRKLAYLQNLILFVYLSNHFILFISVVSKKKIIC